MEANAYLFALFVSGTVLSHLRVRLHFMLTTVSWYGCCYHHCTDDKNRTALREPGLKLTPRSAYWPPALLIPSRWLSLQKGKLWWEKSRIPTPNSSTASRRWGPPQVCQQLLSMTISELPWTVGVDRERVRPRTHTWVPLPLRGVWASARGLCLWGTRGYSAAIIRRMGWLIGSAAFVLLWHILRRSLAVCGVCPLWENSPNTWEKVKEGVCVTHGQEDSVGRGGIGTTFFSHLRGFHREDGPVLLSTDPEGTRSSRPTRCCLGNDRPGDVVTSVTLGEHGKKCLTAGRCPSGSQSLRWLPPGRPEVLTCVLSHYDATDTVRKLVRLLMKGWVKTAI